NHPVAAVTSLTGTRGVRLRLTLPRKAGLGGGHVDTTFLICAILGATLLACEIVAGMLGFGHDHDTDTGGDHDHGHGNALLSMLTVRTVTAAVLFFGLSGLSARYYGAEELPAFGAAVGSGALALYLVAAAMRSLKGLKSDGTARIDRAVGHTGTVYLR